MPDPTSRLNAALEGRYALERELGEGGMATVYLAKDLKHNRHVALKVLKPELAAVVGAERFLAEIETTANLQHPHILPLFDSGEADSFLFYVMPYVEGESLRDRLDRERQLPVDEAVKIATDVAEALQAAHEQGVIHRDIKPANILLSRGRPLVADFGIALAVSAAGGGRLTETGLSLGTPHYMSPEQATGDLGVGGSTDVYALGCVLYEMLVGEPPHTGSTAQAILGKIIAGEPSSATKQRASVPANVDAVIRKALEKVPADRFARVQDFSKGLADEGFRHGEGAVAGTGADVASWRRLTAAFAGVAAIAIFVAGWALLRPQPRSVAVFEVPLEGVLALAGVRFTLSPDGSRIVYVGSSPDGRAQLMQRTLDQLESTAIPGTEGARSPSFSPDGRSVAFLGVGRSPLDPGDRDLKTVSISGGPPSTVTSEGGAPTWGSDETLYYTRGGAVYRVAASGGEPEVFASAVDSRLAFPNALPDGRGLLLTVVDPFSGDSRIAVVGPEGGEVREILTGAMARYAESGHLVYATAEGTLMATPFDVKRLEVGTSHVAMLEGVSVGGTSAAQFALSEAGTLAYRSGAGEFDLVWVSRTGDVEPVSPGEPGDFGYPALSPNGSQLAVAIRDGSKDIWVRQLDRGTQQKLTFEGSNNDRPTWTADGRSVTFVSNRAGSFDLWTKRADGSAPAVLELRAERDILEGLWSSDGEWLIYRLNPNPDLLALRPGRDTVPVGLAVSEWGEDQATLSPDGRWLAYASNETGQDEIYVVPFPNAGDAKWLVSANGGREPLWSHSGQELFYRSGLGDMVSVQIETDSTFAPGQSEVLFSAAGFRAAPNHQMYDVSPDDERFIMIRRGADLGGRKLILALNWFEELKRRVPN